MLNHLSCEGRVQDIKILEDMSVDQYYSTLDTFLGITEKRIKESKKQRTAPTKTMRS